MYICTRSMVYSGHTINCAEEEGEHLASGLSLLMDEVPEDEMPWGRKLKHA